MIVHVLNFILQTKSLFSCFSISIVYWPSEFRHNNLQHMLESHLKAINQQIFFASCWFPPPPMEPQGVGIWPVFFAKRYNPSERGCQIRQIQHWYRILIRAGIQLSVVLGLLSDVNKLITLLSRLLLHILTVVWDY